MRLVCGWSVAPEPALVIHDDALHCLYGVGVLVLVLVLFLLTPYIYSR